MTMLRTIWAELLGLFVDDWGFALALVAWVGIIAALRSYLPLNAPAPLLFIGLAVLTLTFAVRQARAVRKS